MERGERRRFVFGLVVAVIAAAVVGVVLWSSGGLVASLIALGAVGVGVLLALSALRSAWVRRIGAAAAVLVLALAVLVPWRLAVVERTGSPLWGIDVAGGVRGMHSDGERLLFTDDDGLHAIDLRSGQEQWVNPRNGRRNGWSFDVSADGYVFVQIDYPKDTEYRWISPDGEVLWSRAYVRGESDPPFGEVLAADSGSLVVTVEDGGDRTRVVGIGPDGSETWSMQGSSPGLRIGYRYSDLELDSPEDLPAIAAVADVSSENTGRANSFVDPTNGEVLERVESGALSIAAGDVVVYQDEAEAAAATCRLQGRSADGEVSWTQDAPCLDGGAIARGDLVFYPVDRPEQAAGEERAPDAVEAVALNSRTGQWHEVGPLAWFSRDMEAETGVLGTDMVVQREGRQLTGVDPATGEEAWSLEVEGRSPYPTVRAGHGAASVLIAPAERTSHNPFQADEDIAEGTRVLVVDTATGEVTGSLLAPEGVWSPTPVAPGQVVVGQGDRLTLIGAR